jgi:prevent-host-death family protein
MREREKRPMVNTIPATQARNQFGEVLKRVYRDGEQLIIEKDGLPIAAILSHADFEEYRRAMALQQLEELNKAVNREMQAKGITEEEALADLKQIKKEVFEEQYGQALKSRRRKAR